MVKWPAKAGAAHKGAIMEKMWFTISGAFITFFVTWGLTTAISYYSAEKGAMRISPPVSIGGHKYQTISIENYTNDMLDGLVLKVPASTPDAAISSSTLVRLTDLAAQSDARTVKVSDIPPRTSTRLFVPVPQSASGDTVAAINSKSIGISVEDSTKLESRLQRNLLGNLASAGLLAIAVGITLYGFKGMVESMSESFEKRAAGLQKKTNVLTEAVDKSSDETRSRAKRLHELLAKQRILLEGRIRDYARELSFWRDTMRAIVLSGGGSPKDADAIQRVVTERLKTYGTRTSDLDFEAVRIASRWLHEDHEKAGAEARYGEPQA